jgi:RNA polymerase sigma-70 factor, ECF subfamily
MDEITRWAIAARDALAQGSAPGARRQHDEAISRFVSLTQADVWRFIAKLTDATRADDLTQETYLRAWKSLRNFRGESSARTWLLGVAHHVVADHVRSSARRTGLLQRWGFRAAHSLDVGDDNVGSASELGVPGRNDLAGILTALPSDIRIAFVLTQIIGTSYSETAEICGCPVGTVRSRVFRARELLMTAVAASEAV